MTEPDLVERGSQTAKAGFQNEQDVIRHFNQWQTDEYAPQWLTIMGYRLDDIEFVKAMKIQGSFKADVQVQIQVTIKLKSELDVQNLQVKLVSNPNGYNQIDKRWVDTYATLWSIPPHVVQSLKLFTGELRPETVTRDPRRTFLHELSPTQQAEVLAF
ncbi:MAG: type II restriction endonuclease, partial [Planctomycetaceae bacterium]|nr:type II restriction endonuclease [Planctomycetaceae bacterium]